VTSAKGIIQSTHFVVAPTHRTHISPTCLCLCLPASTTQDQTLNNYIISLPESLFMNIVDNYDYSVNITIRPDVKLQLLLVTCFNFAKPATLKKPLSFNQPISKGRSSYWTTGSSSARRLACCGSHFWRPVNTAVIHVVLN
jgi:hypothetical protein